MTDPNTRDHPTDPLCSECSELLGLFVGGRLARDADPRFRDLLRSCTGCRDEYRSTIQGTAELARSLRENRERRAIERDARKRRSARVHVATTGFSRRTKRFYLQLMVVPALLLWMLGRIEAEVEAQVVAQIVWEGGGVSAAGTLLGADIAERDLAGGDVIALQPGARAEIRRGATKLELAGEGIWLVEPDHGRFRLYAGRANVRAHEEVIVVTAAGIATFTAGTSAHVRGEGSWVELECESGRIEWVGPRAASTLGPGERFVTDR